MPNKYILSLSHASRRGRHSIRCILHHFAEAIGVGSTVGTSVFSITGEVANKEALSAAVVSPLQFLNAFDW